MADTPPEHRNTRRRYRSGDDGGREMAEFRPTQLPPDSALRAREVAKPSPADLARAADDLVLVRRHYVPDGKLR